MKLLLIVDNAKHEDQILHDRLTNVPSTRNQHEGHSHGFAKNETQ
jgi:hypothetical protein